MESKQYGWFRQALVKPFSKLIFALALIGAVTGTIGLILGSVSVNKINNLTCYLEPDGTAVLGSSTIWWNKWNSPNETELYFAWEKRHFEDIKWDGNYTLNYFK